MVKIKNRKINCKKIKMKTKCLKMNLKISKWNNRFRMIKVKKTKNRMIKNRKIKFSPMIKIKSNQMPLKFKIMKIFRKIS